MVHLTGVKHQAADALFRLQSKGVDKTELNIEVLMLALSNESFYTDVGTDTEELTEEGALKTTSNSPYISRMFPP